MRPPTDSADDSPTSDVHNQKKKQLFDCLDVAEQGLRGSILEQCASTTQHISNQLNRLNDSAVMRPPRLQPMRNRTNVPKPRKTPDYQVNPHKWKKYSLYDADTSDRTNSAAAFDFLKSIEQRKHDETEQPDDMDMDNAAADGKMMFKRRNAAPRPTFHHSAHLKESVTHDPTSDADRAVLKGSKLVMPEYVVGQKAPAQRKSIAKPTAGGSGGKSAPEMKLDHLFDEDEDDEDSN